MTGNPSEIREYHQLHQPEITNARMSFGNYDVKKKSDNVKMSLRREKKQVEIVVMVGGGWGVFLRNIEKFFLFKKREVTCRYRTRYADQNNFKFSIKETD